MLLAIGGVRADQCSTLALEAQYKTKNNNAHQYRPVIRASSDAHPGLAKKNVITKQKRSII